MKTTSFSFKSHRCWYFLIHFSKRVKFYSVMLPTDTCANLQEASNFEMETKRIDHVKHF